MAILHTINGNYPDKNFGFHLTASNMGLAAKGHIHHLKEIPIEEEPTEEIQTEDETPEEITGLAEALNSKSEADHTHTMVERLYATNPIDSPHNVSLGVSTEDSSTTITVANNNVSINFTSPSVGRIVWVKNENPNDQARRVQFTSEDFQGNQEDNTLATIQFKVNNNA